MLQFVIKYEIDPNSEDKVGNTPAHLAAAEGHLECLKVLVYHRKQPLEVVTCKNNNVSIKHNAVCLWLTMCSSPSFVYLTQCILF